MYGSNKKGEQREAGTTRHSVDRELLAIDLAVTLHRMYGSNKKGEQREAGTTRILFYHGLFSEASGKKIFLILFPQLLF